MNNAAVMDLFLDGDDIPVGPLKSAVNTRAPLSERIADPVVLSRSHATHRTADATRREMASTAAAHAPLLAAFSTHRAVTANAVSPAATRSRHTVPNPLLLLSGSATGGGALTAAVTATPDEVDDPATAAEAVATLAGLYSSVVLSGDADERVRRAAAPQTWGTTPFMSRRNCHTTHVAAYNTKTVRSDAEAASNRLVRSGNSVCAPGAVAGSNGSGSAAKAAGIEGNATTSSVPASAPAGNVPLSNARHSTRAILAGVEGADADAAPVGAERSDFFSTVRKIERADDDLRGGRVGHQQRAVEIRSRRIEAPEMQPQTLRYHTADVYAESCYARRNRRKNYLDLVSCAQLVPRSEHSMDYFESPDERLLDLLSNVAVADQAAAAAPFSGSTWGPAATIPTMPRHSSAPQMPAPDASAAHGRHPTPPAATGCTRGLRSTSSADVLVVEDCCEDAEAAAAEGRTTSDPFKGPSKSVSFFFADDETPSPQDHEGGPPLPHERASPLPSASSTLSTSLLPRLDSASPAGEVPTCFFPKAVKKTMGELSMADRSTIARRTLSATGVGGSARWSGTCSQSVEAEAGLPFQPGCRDASYQDYQFQRRALTSMSTAFPLCLGTNKQQSELLPNYAGFVPVSERNSSRQLLREREWRAKVEDVVSTDASTTLHMGCRRDDKGPVPGYFLHSQHCVDHLGTAAATATASASARASTVAAEAAEEPADVLRALSKSYLTIAVHGEVVDNTRTMTRAGQGKRCGTTTTKPLAPRNPGEIRRTVEGSMLQDVLSAVQASSGRLHTRSTPPRIF